MFKNVASQKLIVFAFDSATGLPKGGDAANITACVSKDYGTVTVLGDTSATEMDATNAKGYYLFDLTQAETNGDCLMFSGKSSTPGIVIVGAPATVFTFPTTGILAPATAGRTLVVDASGLADANAVKIGPTGSGTAQTARDIGASVLLASGQKVDVDTIKTNPVVNAGTVTFPTGATLASTTNITAGTITTATNLTNAPTAGDFTATMKTSIGTAVAASAVASVTAAVTLSAAESWVIQSGTAGAGGASTITIATAVGTTADLVGCLIKITSGTGANQTRVITGYVNSTKVVTVDYAWVTAPDNTSVYAILFDNAPVLNSSLDVTFANTSIATVTTVTNQLTAAAIATGVWQDTTAGDFTTASSIGKSLFTGNHAPGAASGLSLVGSQMDLVNAPNATAITAIQSGLATPTNITAGTITTVTNLTNAPTSGDFTATMKASILAVVWDTAISGHTTSGTFGAALNAAGSSGDPWATSLPGAYGAGTAGFIVGTNLNATVTSRMATYAQPTGFLAATFPSGTIANTTNGVSLANGAIVTATFGVCDFPAAMKTSLNAATPASVQNIHAQTIDAATIKTDLDNLQTGTASGVFATAALANGPSGGGGGGGTVTGYASGQDPATLVLDALAASHNGAGTIGQKINAAGGAADPLTNNVPGTYAAGTAGAALGRIGASQVTTSLPVATNGTITLVKGDDYFFADGRALVFNGPFVVTDLTGATITLKSGDGAILAIGTVVTPTGSQQVRVDVPHAQTANLTVGKSTAYGLTATLPDSDVVTIVQGQLVTSGLK